MSLQTDLASLEADLLAEATTAATYSRNVTSVSLEILQARQEQKVIGPDDAEVIAYEQHVFIRPADLAALATPQQGDRITFTNAASLAITLEVNRNPQGDCYRLTRSGRFFRVFTKKLVV